MRIYVENAIYTVRFPGDCLAKDQSHPYWRVFVMFYMIPSHKTYFVCCCGSSCFFLFFASHAITDKKYLRFKCAPFAYYMFCNPQQTVYV